MQNTLQSSLSQIISCIAPPAFSSAPLHYISTLLMCRTLRSIVCLESLCVWVCGSIKWYIVPKERPASYRDHRMSLPAPTNWQSTLLVLVCGRKLGTGRVDLYYEWLLRESSCLLCMPLSASIVALRSGGCELWGRRTYKSFNDNGKISDFVECKWVR